MRGSHGAVHAKRLTICWAMMAALAAVAPTLASASGVRERVHGGAITPIDTVPYQVALINAAAPSEWDGQFCGGTILDATHVVTAAHCVFNLPLRPGTAVRPADVKVMAGRAALSKVAMGSDLNALAGVSFDPNYDLGTNANDAAVLTLATALDLSGPVPAAAALLDSADLAPVAPGSQALVSGWGQVQDLSYPTDLRSAWLPIVSDNACAPVYGTTAFVGDKMLCAGGQAGFDSCFGDSGGPLVVDGVPGTPAIDPRLAGIVSFGPDPCGQADLPGVYTEVADTAIHDYLVASPIDAPQFTAAPSITSATVVGQELSCSPGTWSGAPTFRYQFVRGSGASAVAVTAPDTTTTYTLTSDDVGDRISCVVEARNGGGFGIAKSGQSGLVRYPVTEPPATTPTPTSTPTPTPPAPAADVVPPVAKIVKARCTGSRCVIDVTVTDPGVSTGIRGLQAKVRSTYRTTCRKAGRRTTCTKHRTRTLKAQSRGAGRYQLVMRALPVGTHVVTVIAIDVAGNRQIVADRKTVRTKRR